MAVVREYVADLLAEVDTSQRVTVYGEDIINLDRDQLIAALHLAAKDLSERMYISSRHCGLAKEGKFV